MNSAALVQDGLASGARVIALASNQNRLRVFRNVAGEWEPHFPGFTSNSVIRGAGHPRIRLDEIGAA